MTDRWTSITGPQHTKIIAHLRSHPRTEMILLGDSHMARFSFYMFLPCTVASAGVAGDTNLMIRERALRCLFSHSPNLKRVIGMSGSNDIVAIDFSQPRDKIVDRIASIVKEIVETVKQIRDELNKNGQSEVILEWCNLLVPKIMNIDIFEYIEFANYCLEINLARMDIPVINVFDLTCDSETKKRKEELFLDSLHLNMEGYRKWWDLINSEERL